MAGSPMTITEQNVGLEISDAVYPLAAIHGAAVIFIDRAYIRIDRASPGRTRILLRPKEGGAGGEALGGEVLNELLHQSLRVEVGARTDKLRELVIGKAIMAAETPSDGGVEFSDDPLGIARPWEETYLGEPTPSQSNDEGKSNGGAK